jgi:Raf kinase inhibitor-like YbhB/YbcL family protein
MALELHSPAFGDGEEIPRDYTADGENEHPPLEIRGVPDQAISLALVVEDPDAPRATPFTHWIVWDIPANVEQIGRDLPISASEGTNDFGRQGYGGPKPPSGRHRYVFKLYALDTELAERRALTKDELERRIEGHVLDETELVGTYARAA